jgi:REP element-mobilizing transposase RayT
MVNYRRNKTGNPDDIFFFTIVTMNRTAWFADSEMRELAVTVLKRIKKRFECRFKAWVILPDHLQFNDKSVKC